MFSVRKKLLIKNKKQMEDLFKFLSSIVDEEKKNIVQGLMGHISRLKHAIDILRIMPEAETMITIGALEVPINCQDNNVVIKMLKEEIRISEIALKEFTP